MLCVLRQRERRFRRPRCNTGNGVAGSATVSPMVTQRKRELGGGGEEDDTVRMSLKYTDYCSAFLLLFVLGFGAVHGSE